MCFLHTLSHFVPTMPYGTGTVVSPFYRTEKSRPRPRSDGAALQVQVCLSLEPSSEQLSPLTALARHRASRTFAWSFAGWRLESDLTDPMNALPRTSSKARPWSCPPPRPPALLRLKCCPGRLVRGQAGSTGGTLGTGL